MKKVKCGVCGRKIHSKDGLILIHGPTFDNNCSGSGMEVSKVESGNCDGCGKEIVVEVIDGISYPQCERLFGLTMCSACVTKAGDRVREMFRAAAKKDEVQQAAERGFRSR